MKSKEEIYEGALKLIIERGYDNTPLSLISKELGLSKGGLFHHFNTKEQLLYEIIKHVSEKEFLPIMESAKKIEDPKERLIYFFREYINLLSEAPVGIVAVHETRRLDPDHFNEIRKIWRELLNLISGAIAELQASGQAKQLNTTFSAFALIGMCSWLFYWFDYSRKESAEEVFATFSEIYLQGLLK